MKPKNNTYYFSHDCNAQSDVKLIRVKKELGWAGYGLYWALIERLRCEDSYSLPFAVDALAYDLRADEEVIERLITDFGLFEVDAQSESFYSPSLIRRMGVYDEKAENLSKVRSEAAKKGNEKRWKGKKTEETSTQGNKGLTDMLQGIAQSIQRQGTRSKSRSQNAGSEEMSTPEPSDEDDQEAVANSSQTPAILSQMVATSFQTSARVSQAVAQSSQVVATPSHLPAGVSQPNEQLSQIIADLSQTSANSSQTSASLSQTPASPSQANARTSQGVANNHNAVSNYRNASQTDRKTSQDIANKKRLYNNRINKIEEGIVRGGVLPPGVADAPLPPLDEKNEDEKTSDRSEATDPADSVVSLADGGAEPRKEKSCAGVGVPIGQKSQTGVDYEEIKNYWNEKTKDAFGIISILSETRKRNIRKRIGETSKEDFFRMIDKVSESAYLQGDNETGWTAGFDFCLRPTKYAKILDGCYDDNSCTAREKIKTSSPHQPKHDNSENETDKPKYSSVADYLDCTYGRSGY